MYLGKYLFLKLGFQQINAIFLEHLNNLSWDPKTNIFRSFFSFFFFLLNKDMCLENDFVKVFFTSFLLYSSSWHLNQHSWLPHWNSHENIFLHSPFQQVFTESLPGPGPVIQQWPGQTQSCPKFPRWLMSTQVKMLHNLAVSVFQYGRVCSASLSMWILWIEQYNWISKTLIKGFG